MGRIPRIYTEGFFEKAISDNPCDPYDPCSFRYSAERRRSSTTIASAFCISFT